MRTRRSWRNQNRLWKMLANGSLQPDGTATPQTPKTKAAPMTAADVDAMWWLGKTSRNLLKRDIAKGTTISHTS